MPILIHVDNLEPGMVLGANVVNGFTTLLPHNRKLSDADINALQRKMPDLSVPIYDPLLDGVVEFDDNRHDQEVSLEVRRNIAKVTHKVSNMVRSGVNLDANQVRGMENAVKEMMEYLESNPVTLAIIQQSSNWDDYIQEHTANVFYLSMLVGNTIRNYIKNERERQSSAKVIHNAMNLTPLGTAAMFHDIGMAPISHLYHKSEPLADKEKEQIRMHPIVGADMLPDTVDPMARLVIRCHHENLDGTGYPSQMEGVKINIFARILRVADAYTAAISDKVYAKAKTPLETLYEMLYGPSKRCFDPVVVKVFSSFVQPLPIGAKLKLNNGQTAVVVKHNRLDSFSPLVIVAFDEFGDPITRDVLRPPFELKQNEDIKAVSFGKIDLGFIYEPPPEADESLTKHDYVEVFDYAFP